jgi:poly-gamma-glutamate capsule biosynthesis protein CapA/YwtB (metallophosphatase superfamily)
MGGIATLAEASVDQAAALSVIPMTKTIDVILLLHSIFDIVPAASAPVRAGVQRHIMKTAGSRPTTNHTDPAYSAFLLTHADHGGPELSARAPRLITTAINRAIATHGFGPKPIGDTAHTLTPGCC